jgi:hypothetical protein
MIKVPEKA